MHQYQSIIMHWIQLTSIVSCRDVGVFNFNCISLGILWCPLDILNLPSKSFLWIEILQLNGLQTFPCLLSLPACRPLSASVVQEVRICQKIWCLISEVPSGNLTYSYGKIHHFSWENPLCLWPFSIAMLVHQRVCQHCQRHSPLAFTGPSPSPGAWWAGRWLLVTAHPEPS